MIPMMMMMMRPTERVKAVKTWNQIAAADRGELTTMDAKSIRDKNAKGEFVYDKNRRIITEYDGLPDSAFAQGGQYYGVKAEIPYQDAWGYKFLFEDDVCFAYLGISTTRPSAANGGYSLYIKKWDSAGRWKNNYFATTFVQYKTHDNTGNVINYRIEEISEVDGACTVTLTRTDTGAQSTVTFNMLTDMDDTASRPTCQTGNVNAKSGTTTTTKSIALKLAGHINEPLEEHLKIGSATSKAYDPTGVRTRWNDGRTWSVANNAAYWATCYKYEEYYYAIRYSEGGETLLDAVPIYDCLLKEAGFVNRVDGKLIFAHRDSRRKLKPVYEDYFLYPEVGA